MGKSGLAADCFNKGLVEHRGMDNLLSIIGIIHVQYDR